MNDELELTWRTRFEASWKLWFGSWFPTSCFNWDLCNTPCVEDTRTLLQFWRSWRNLSDVYYILYIPKWKYANMHVCISWSYLCICTCICSRIIYVYISYFTEIVMVGLFLVILNLFLFSHRTFFFLNDFWKFISTHLPRTTILTLKIESAYKAHGYLHGVISINLRTISVP